MVNVEYVAQHVAKYIFARLGKHLNIDANYQRRVMEKAVTSACDLYRVCKGVTRKGSRCSRHVAGDAEYCFQHRGATMTRDNPRHRSSDEKESSGSDEESSEDESSTSEEESSGSEEESSEEDTEEDSDEESSGSSEEEPSGSDEDSSEEDAEDESSASEKDTEDDASASEEESEEESSGESSDEEVPPPKKTKKAKRSKKTKTTVEDCPDLSLQQTGTPLVREFVRDKDRLACAFLEAVRDVSREASRAVSHNPDLPADGDVIYRWLTVEAITAITHINNTGVIMYDIVDRISTDLSSGRYEHIDLDRLAQQISHNLGMDA